MTSTSMRNNFCQEPETHTEQEGKGNLLIKFFFFLLLILKEYGSLNLLQLQKETSSHHHHHCGVGLPSCSDYRRQTRSLLSSEIAVSLDWLFPSPIPRKPSVGVSPFHNFSTLFPQERVSTSPPPSAASVCSDLVEYCRPNCTVPSPCPLFVGDGQVSRQWPTHLVGSLPIQLQPNSTVVGYEMKSGERHP